ncbi:hypothetical protein AN958_06354 [Leucoagaricus sp. SymC.cos]|nr:hypothetical protein AN958_06354 [Leucoagaricus sp. SymC.cos]
MNVTREREKEKGRGQMSLSNEALATLPVLSIERMQQTPASSISKGKGGEDTPPLRRSVSLSGLDGVNLDKPLPSPVRTTFARDEQVVRPDFPQLRTPSPGPNLLAELSTIIEVDTSGISKHIPPTPSTFSTRSFSPPPQSSIFPPQLSHHQHDEEQTMRRPVTLRPPTTPLMTSSPLEPSTPAHNETTTTAICTIFSAAPAGSDADISADPELELSTSHLAFQVQDAMARASTSWVGGSDKAFVIDADASFLNVQGSHEGPFTDEEDEGLSSIDEGPSPLEAHADFSAMAVINHDLDSTRSLSTREDNASRINNSGMSVINPNELYTVDDATMDLASLDPDLRAAVSKSMMARLGGQQSPSSAGHSSVTSGRTVTLSSPPLHSQLNTASSPPSTSTSASRSVSAPTSSSSTNPSTSPSTSTPASVPKPTLQPFATPSTGIPHSSILPSPTTKRRVASSFLPRLRSPPPPLSSISAPGSTKNSPSPTKAGFDSSSPVTSSSGIPSPAKRNSYGVRKRDSGGVQSPRAATFFLPTATSSTPAKGKTKKGFGSVGIAGAQPQHGRKSSVPIATWRSSKELSNGVVASLKEKLGDEVEERSVKGPKVRVVEASSEIDPSSVPSTIGQPQRVRWPSNEPEEDGVDAGKLGVDGIERGHGGGRWSPRFPHREESPVLGYEREFDIQGEGTRSLGSPFGTPGDADNVEAPRFHSPSRSPSPAAHATCPPQFRSKALTNSHGTHQRALDLSTTPTSNTNRHHSPSPSPQLPPHSLVPSSNIPPSSNSISRNSSFRAGAKDRADGDVDDTTRIFDPSSLSGRPSRRVSTPLRLFWGSNGSASSSGNSGDTGGVSERQPSPLRSVVRADKFEREEDEGYIGRGRYGTTPRASIDESTRPSIDSTRPSMDSYCAPSSSISARRASPEPGYHKYVVDAPSTLRPPTRLRERERDREGLVSRVRKRSMSVQDNFINDHMTSSSRDHDITLSPASVSAVNLSTAALSARERLARARYGDLGGGGRPRSSMSMRSSGRTESFHGSRRYSAARPLTTYDRERSPGRIGGIGMERSVSERDGSERERSGSVGAAALGRYVSLRSASELGGNSSSTANLSVLQHQPSTSNPRLYSRMTFSESSGSGSAVGGHGRRESVTGGIGGGGGGGLMESPTFTVSTSVSGGGGSASRGDTPRSTSTSTGATSISQLSNTNSVKEELRELKDKHAVETGALLNALSDSQRTCRVLREENGELRERMAEVERDSERLKRVLGELERDVEQMRREREREWEKERDRVGDRLWDPRGSLGPSVGPGGGPPNWRGLVAPMTKHHGDLGVGSRTAVRAASASASMMPKWQAFERNSDVEDTMRFARSKLDNVMYPRKDADLEPYPERERSVLNEDDLVTPIEEHSPELPQYRDEIEIEEPERVPSRSMLPPPNPPTASTAHLRRPSTSSSIFPIPPANMTMLLHDEMGLLPGLDSNRSSACPSLFPSRENTLLLL